MSNADPYTLAWSRTTSGGYYASAPINGEADAYAAFVTRGQGSWWVEMTTYGRPLGTEERRTLAEVKNLARLTYRMVESVNR
jgi:hypothetical protein